MLAEIMHHPELVMEQEEDESIKGQRLYLGALHKALKCLTTKAVFDFPPGLLNTLATKL